MRYYKWYFLTFCIVLATFTLPAQDKIYYKKNKIEDWKVNEITPGYLKAVDVKNPKISYSVSQPDLLFVINNRGNFLVIPQLFDSKMKAEIYIKYYLNYNNKSFHKEDQIITKKNIIITANVLTSTEKEIQYEINHKTAAISRSDIALIIYKDGSHTILAPVDKVYSVLKTIQDEYYQSTYSTTSLKNNTDSITDRAATEPTKEETDKRRPIDSDPEVDSVNGSISREKIVTDHKTVPKNLGKAENSKSPEKNVPGDNNILDATKELDPVTLQSLQEKAISSIKELEAFIKIICNKGTDADQIQKAIDQSLLLFASEDSRVEVSSKNKSDAQQYKIRVYLNRLGMIKYNKVSIDWYNIQYAGKVRKNPDGTYGGYIEFEQKFTGVSGDNKIYQDITRKTTEITIKPYYKKSSGTTLLQWDVFLGNIGINVSKF